MSSRLADLKAVSRLSLMHVTLSSAMIMSNYESMVCWTIVVLPILCKSACNCASKTQPNNIIYESPKDFRFLNFKWIWNLLLCIT